MLVPQGISSKWSSRLILLLVISSVVGASAWLWWLAHMRSDIRYLVDHGGAEWIVYPVPPQARAQWAVERRAIFRRPFFLERPPEAAIAAVRAFKECRLTVNGTTVETPGGGNWKEGCQRDISAYLRAGQNELIAAVSNSEGPPALWLRISAPGWSLSSDSEWQVTLDGAIERGAVPAGAPPEFRRGNPLTGGEQTLSSMRTQWPILLGIAVIALAIWAVAHAAGRAGKLPTSDAALLLATVGVAVLWVVLFFNNLQSLLFPIGFDAEHHLAYIRYIQQYKALPLASQGWETHQPPLYYLISAVALGLFGLAAESTDAVVVLRALALIAALVQIGLVAASLRLLFPNHPRRQLAGLLVAAFLPMNLYIAHYQSNDLLAAVLASASIYLCLTILRSGRPSLGRLILFGICLGGALLTKVTTLAIAPVLFGVLVGQLIVGRERDMRVWARLLGVPLLVCFAVSGWYFLRVWWHFGKPLVGSYDPVSGFNWWQTPGYSTASFYCRFGRSLADPFFSGYQSLADGLYSTMWGDGLWGGTGDLASRTPWNYQLMAAGYLLALLPTAAMLVGLALTLVQLVRRPRGEWFVLAGLAFAMTAALVYHFLRLPYACHIKAFYALPALIPLSAMAGWGMDVLMSRWRPVAIGVGVLLATWATTAYASYWVLSSSSQTQAWIGLMLASSKRYGAAVEPYQAAVRADERNERARVGLGRLLLELNRPREALEQFRRGLELSPESFQERCGLALALEKLGEVEPALQQMKRVVASAPDFQDQGALGRLYLRKGDSAAAVDAFRRSVATLLGDPLLHRALGDALVLNGQTAEAIEQYRASLRLQPRSPEVLGNLARILATHADAQYRDGPEAVQLAEQAAALSGYKDVRILDGLAAAYAEAGRFAEAVQMQERALELPGVSEQTSLSTELRDRLKLYESKKPYREAAKPP
jgi:tetratricopeptide (TPR) repeat protein